MNPRHDSSCLFGNVDDGSTLLDSHRHTCAKDTVKTHGQSRVEEGQAQVAADETNLNQTSVTRTRHECKLKINRNVRTDTVVQKPANMLTPPSSNDEQNSPKNTTDLLSAFNVQMQQLQFNNQDDHQRQEALANLFKSLSSLASGQPKQCQGGNLINAINGCSQDVFITTNDNIYSPTTNPCAMSTTSNQTLASSIQSVVAAAVMQQQLVNAALNQAPRPTAAPLQSQQNQSPKLVSTQPTSMSTQPPGALSFFSEQQLPAGLFSINAIPGRSQQNPPFLGLEHDLQYSSMGMEQQAQQPQQPQQQRINYCTICNKELCNKYFMKTHMLKMHGINLEMEQSGENEDDCESSGSAGEREIKNNEQMDTKANESSQHRSPSEKKLSTISSHCSASSSASCSSPQATNLTNHQTKNGDKQSSAQSAGKKSSTTSPNNATKQATSVMNGFAGNSMGGVVCDICNKELCSKYFLKVHKQNTHGIMTDYQDAGQFVYPFGNPMAASNPFMAPISMGPLGIGTTSGPSIYSSPAIYGRNNGNQTKNPSTDNLSGKRPKRARTMKDTVTGESKSDSSSLIESMSANGSSSSKQLDTVYRLMMAQQQGDLQKQSQQHVAQSPPSMQFDPMLANSMGAFMCFGAMGPFGPAGISPSMIVEMILRNQHLFNRNNQQSSQQSSRQADKSGKDGNNNESKSKAAAGGKNSKGTNNSRYFTHYTEACPMCDRRFKSIKWLKTHMMNDHKQEIGTYMQMMMQQLYASKNQPISSLTASMPIEQKQHSLCFPVSSMSNQQQHQPHPRQQPQPQASPQPQHPTHRPISVQHNLSVGNQITSSSDLQHVNMHQQQQRTPSQQINLVQDFLNQQKQYMQQKLLLDFSNTTMQPSLDEQELIIDARCKRESVSPSTSHGCKMLSTREQSFDDRSPSDQMDLNSKFMKAAEQSLGSNDDFATCAQDLIGGDRLDTSSFFLEDKSNNADDCSTKFSYQDELNQSATNLDIDRTSGNDLSLTRQPIKTTSTTG